LYESIFGQVFIYSLFGFEIFWRQNIGAKAAHKMLMKLTSGLFVGIRVSSLTISKPEIPLHFGL